MSTVLLLRRRAGRLGKGCAGKRALPACGPEPVHCTKGTAVSASGCTTGKQMVEFLGLYQSRVNGVFAVCLLGFVFVIAFW